MRAASEYDALRAATRYRQRREMWFNADDFQFAWKKMSGDVSLTANVSFAGPAEMRIAKRY